jgi:hypothetical protein
VPIGKKPGSYYRNKRQLEILLKPLKDLAQLLLRSDTMALDFVHPLTGLVGVEDYYPQLTELKEMVYEYNFDAALELIEKLTREL